MFRVLLFTSQDDGLFFVVGNVVLEAACLDLIRTLFVLSKFETFLEIMIKLQNVYVFYSLSKEQRLNSKIGE